ncbi:MAG: hypothetical protein N2487_03995 [Verrucomicrobiae bacterium]|nr:hypothetical protein [Verrucomicrobiae bacterium]
MEKTFKLLLENLSPRETRELIEAHVRKIELDEATKKIIIHVDKRYAFNLISSHDQIQKVIKGVKKAFGGDFGLTLKLSAPVPGSEREKALPHTIHYA